MRTTLLLAFMTALCTVVGVAGWRLSIDTLALIIGVGLGCVLMTPICLLLGWAVRQNTRALEEQMHNAPSASPPVVIVQPGPATSYPGAMPQQTQPPALIPPPSYPVNLPATNLAAHRNWRLRVYGEEDHQEDMQMHNAWREQVSL